MGSYESIISIMKRDLWAFEHPSISKEGSYNMVLIT
jgi:hypothetical protein